MYRTLPLALFACLAPAQSQSNAVVVPDVEALYEGNSQSEHPFARPSTRLQIVLAAQRLAPSVAQILELQLRRDGFGNNAFPAQTVDPFEVWAGRAAVTPDKMSTNFAANVQGSLIRYFGGKLQLPQQAPQLPAPFAIKIPLSAPIVHVTSWGPFVLELRADTANLPNVAYLLDAQHDAVQGGSWRSYGVRGQFATKDDWALHGNAPDLLVPGGQIDVGGLTYQSGYPSVLLLGFSRTQAGPVPLPLDLGPLGAPGNLLQVSPDLAVSMTMRPAFVGWTARAVVPIPKDARLDGFDIYAQSIHAQGSANPLGLVFSEGMQARIRTQRQVLEQSLYADSSNAQDGTLPSAPGAPVIRFVGTFR